MQGAGFEGQVPVFVFPSSLTFHIDDESSHKQVLTLYNPYGFQISYLILCNAPDRYYIIDSSGCLNPFNRIDVIVRHLNPLHKNINQNDKLRIQVTQIGSNQIMGKRDISLILHPGVPDPIVMADKEKFENVQYPSGYSSTSPKQQEFGSIEPNKDSKTFYLIACGACLLIGVLLPTHNDPASSQSMIPPYLHMTVTVKMICAYILGLLTYIFVHQN